MLEASPFVGREVELRLARDLLSTRPPAPVALHLQGVPGIGKSALLHEITAMARELGHAVHVVARERASDERSRAVAERLVPVRRRTLLVVDDWDALVMDEPHLVDRLDRATGPLVLLLGSRRRPGACFLESALFPDRLHAIELGGLSEIESARLLRRRELSPAEARRVHQACDGQPFAMLLMTSLPGLLADGARAGHGGSREGAAIDLVRRLVEQIRDPQRVEALELLSFAGTLNERELGVALGLRSDEARGLFEWLRAQTIVETGDSGLALDSLVRAAIVADLRLRDPGRARALVVRLIPAIQESLAWRGSPRSRALDQLCALAANAPQDPVLAQQFDLRGARVAQARVREHADALALIGSLEGAASQAIAARLIAFDPASITVVHGATGIDGVMIRVELRGSVLPPGLREPALDRLVEVLARTGDLPAGRLVRVTRFFVARTHHQLPCFELGALSAAMTRRTMVTPEPFLSIVYLHENAIDAWRGHLEALRYVLREDAAAIVDGQRLVPCFLDFADVGAILLDVVRWSWSLPAPPLHDEAAAPSAVDRSEPVPTALLAEDVEAEVVRALSHLRDLVQLRGSPLGPLMFAAVDERERAERLQSWLREAITATEDMRRGDLVARSLRACFEATRSIDEAATFARMSVSTLKRYRKLGVGRIVALARRQVLTATRSD